MREHFPSEEEAKPGKSYPGPDAFQRPSMVADDVQSFRSYDPRRAKERKYKPKEPSRFGQEVADLPNGEYTCTVTKMAEQKSYEG